VAPGINASSLAWSWHHPDGKYHAVIVGGPRLDDKGNIYLTLDQGVRKFSPDGQVLWYWEIPVMKELFFWGTSLMGGALYGFADSTPKDSKLGGTAYAISLDTGSLLWERKLKSSCWSNAFVDAHKGIVLIGSGRAEYHANAIASILALNASDGSTLWEFTAEYATWTLAPNFPGDNTFLFMDVGGGVSRVGLDDGKLIWYKPGEGDDRMTHANGGSNLGPGGDILYTCSVVNKFESEMEGYQGRQRGLLRAYQVSDGMKLWELDVQIGCVGFPTISPDGSYGVVPLGFNPRMAPQAEWTDQVPRWVQKVIYKMSEILGLTAKSVPWSIQEWLIKSGYLEPSFPYAYSTPMKTNLLAFNPKTGRMMWELRPPPYEPLASLGDVEGYFVRLDKGNVSGAHATRDKCQSLPWSVPVLDATGTVYVGHINGQIYAVKDSNNDGLINPGGEVSSFDTSGSFLHSGPALAPGMMAIASCDTMFVFKS